MKLALLAALLLGVALATSSPARAMASPFVTAGVGITPSSCAFDCESCVRACNHSSEWCRAQCTAIASACCEAAGRKPPPAAGFCGCR